MKTECPHCGQHYDVDKEYENKTAACSSCGKNFILTDRLKQQSIAAPKLVPEQQTNNIPPQTNNCCNSPKIETQSSGNNFKRLSCEMCGSTDLLKENGIFVCQYCGTKYSLEEARKMMISGTVNVTGTVKVDASEKLRNYYTIARRAKAENNCENAAKYYDLILQDDPESWEASFYSVYYKALPCKNQLTSDAAAVRNCLKSVVSLIEKQISDSQEKEAVYQEITGKISEIANVFGNGSINLFENLDDMLKKEFAQEYTQNVIASAQICYTWGDLIENQEEAKKLSCISWKKAIELHTMCIKYCENKKFNAAVLEKYTAKIRRVEPNYTLPETRSAGCYVATAVYGSYDCPEVWTLRRFRDDTLGASWYGKLFIKSYYSVSPTVVKYFGHTKIFQSFFRKKLDKFVKKLNRQGVASTPYVDKHW